MVRAKLQKRHYLTGMSFGLADILFIIVIFQLLFTSVFLFTHGVGGKGGKESGRRSSNGLLGVFFLVIGLNLLDNLFLRLGVYARHPAFALWSVWLLLLFGPLLYLYTQSVLYQDFRFGARKWGHFLPFAVLFVATEIYWQSLGPAEQRLLLVQLTTQRAPVTPYWNTALIFLHFFFYVALSFVLIGRFKKAAGEAFSNYRRMDIRWLSYTLLFFSVAMLLAGLNSVIGRTPLAVFWWPVFLIVIFLVWVYINSLLLKALKQPELFAVLKEREIAGGPPPEAAAEKEEGDWTGVLAQVKVQMETQRPWLEPDLTLEQLAAQLRLRPKLLSQAINAGLGQNFFEFINTYRIEEAKRLLTDPADKKVTVLEVLYAVGFNSKSSFNTVFKKQTGLTPSEFKKTNGG